MLVSRVAFKPVKTVQLPVVKIIVTAGTVANYTVLTGLKATRDTSICAGTPLSLLRPGFDASAVYTWTASPTSVLTGSNPSVSPIVSTKYYVSVTGGTGGCAAISTDSVIVVTYNPPALFGIADTILCRNEVISLGKTPIQANTTYSWSPATGLSSATDPNATLTVQPNVTKIGRAHV